jgi:cell fate (sporulation/competence/biofilm development) regulator YlbF (YheA/YmcA/DUF963 family)
LSVFLAFAAEAEEARLRGAMDKQKAEYKAAFDSLRDMKAEIESIQRNIEVSRLSMQSDFESWLANCLAMLAASGAESQRSVLGLASVADPTPRTAPTAYSAATPAAAQPAHTSAATMSSSFAFESRAPRTEVATATTAIPGMPALTGDAAADNDIMAFYRAAQELRRMKSQGATGMSSALAEASRVQQAIQQARNAQ